MAAMSAMEPHHVNGSLGERAAGDPRPAFLREPRAPPGGLPVFAVGASGPLPEPRGLPGLCWGEGP